MRSQSQTDRHGGRTPGLAAPATDGWLAQLDFEMPRLDGLGVLEELRAQMRTAGLPVILLTSHSRETEEKALDLEAHDYRNKPVQTRSLVARVKSVLKRVQG